MSRRLMLAATGPASVIPDPLPGGGGVDPGGTSWPATSDTTLLALRPSGRLVGSATVTDTATRETAGTALANAVTADGQGSFLSWDGVGPDYRTELFLQPGNVYGEGGGSDWRAIVGTNPASRTVQATDTDSGGVIHTFGSIYLENLHLVARTNASMTAPKYPWHITGGEMCIAANCTFDLSEILPGTVEGGSGIAGWVGADGDSGMTIILYGCDFIPGPLANLLNIHDGGTPEHPMTLIFVDCTGLDAQPLVCPGGASTDGQKNKMYVINTPCASLSADNDGEVYTDSSAPAASGSTGTINRGVTTWPIPAGGLSEFWQGFYYPSTVGGTMPVTFTPTVTDAAPMAPVVGRTYFTRVKPTQGMRVTRSGVNVTTAAGTLSQQHTPADTPYVRDEAITADPPASDPVAAIVGENVWQAYFAYTRYPGDNGIWHRVKFTDAAVRVTGSADLAGLTTCYYSDDGVTLVPVTAGTPHPLPFIRAT